MMESNLSQQFATCEAVLFDPQKENYEEVLSAILAIEKAHFGEKAFPEKVFTEAFSKPETIVVLLKDRENNIVGFSYAQPINTALKYGFDSEREILPNTAYISDTAIAPDHTGYGLVKKIMVVLEDELIKRGYEYLDRDAAIENGYAEKIVKVYKEKILIAEPHDSEYGPQMFFRIKL